MEPKPEKLYSAEVTVLVKARDKNEAEEKIYQRRLIVDDIIDVKEEELDHIEDLAFRERIKQNLLKDLSSIDSKGIPEPQFGRRIR